MMKAIRPEFDTEMESHDIRNCKYCNETIQQDCIKGIWSHGDWNRFDCTQPNPQPKKFKINDLKTCKLH